MARPWTGAFVIEVRPDSPLAWPIIPSFLKRVAGFGEAVGRVDGPRFGMAIDFLRQFAGRLLGQPASMRAWVALEGEDVVAHVIAEVTDYHQEREVAIAQYWSDVALPPWVHHLILGEIRTWGRAVGAKYLRAVARTAVHARAFRLHGMEPTGQVLVEQKLEENNGVG